MRSILTIFVLLILEGCTTTSKYLIHPVSNPHLREIADRTIYKDIPTKDRKYLSFAGAYKGLQCLPDYKVVEFKDFEPYECSCFHYRTNNDQGITIYIGSKGGSSQYSSVCFDTANIIIETPNPKILKKAINNAKEKHISLDEIKSITESYLNEKTSFGKWPILVFQTHLDKVVWKSSRIKGKMNCTVYEFEIDAKTGIVEKVDSLHYERSFWQWISGNGI